MIYLPLSCSKMELDVSSCKSLSSQFDLMVSLPCLVMRLSALHLSEDLCICLKISRAMACNRFGAALATIKYSIHHRSSCTKRASVHGHCRALETQKLCSVPTASLMSGEANSSDSPHCIRESASKLSAQNARSGCQRQLPSSCAICWCTSLSSVRAGWRWSPCLPEGKVYVQSCLILSCYCGFSCSASAKLLW